MTLDFAEPALDGGASRRIDPAFRAHYLTIFRLCMRQLGDPCDAEDAAQETFRRALQQRGGVVGDPLPWLITVARNVCIDELRRRRSGRDALERSLSRGMAPSEEREGSTNPERVVVGRMFVNELLDCLTPAERRVVAGSLIDGRSGGELAASLGVTASTARVLLARARGKLRRYLEDGQAYVTGAAFAGWRGAERLRQRLLARPLALQARPEMLLPALVITAVVSGATASAGAAVLPAGDVADHFTTAAHRVDMSADGGASRTGAAVLAGPAAARATTDHASPHAGGPSATSPFAAVLPPPGPDQVFVSDFAPSPDYSSDHTIFMVGSGGCAVSCYQLFRSSDGGASWSYVPTNDLQSPQLLIPSSSYADGRFYAAGGNLLQVTTDRGGHFQTDDPLLGYATVAPAWLPTQVVVSDVGLSFIDNSQVPHTISRFGPAETAAGPAVLIPSAGGFTALQLVQNYLTGGPDTLLSCSGGGCVRLGQTPLSGNVQLIASPDFSSDHTLFAVGGGVAVSRDGGATFTMVSTQPLFQAMAIAGPDGVRLVAVDTAFSHDGDLVLVYSDDLGRTWHDAALGSARGAVYVNAPRVIAPGKLIASAEDPARPGTNVFICSADGATWSGCTAG